MRMKQTSTAGSKSSRKKQKRRCPHNAQSDWARWAHQRMDQACFERASHPKA